MGKPTKVQWVYDAGTSKELAKRYDEWAKTYDAHILTEAAWTGHIHIADAFARFVPPSAKILDIGCGTGLAGIELAKRGFSQMDGFDLSPGMLAEARQLDIYAELKVAALGGPLDYPSASYESAIACGVFSVGHATADGLDEVVRIIKPGGYFSLTLRTDIYEPDGYKAQDETFAADGKWELAEVSEPLALLPKEEPKIYHWVRTYKILS